MQANSQKINQINSEIKKGLNEISITNKGSKLGMKAMADLNNAQNNGATPNVPLIAKTFGELKIVSDAGAKLNVGNMPSKFLEGKLINALESQKATFAKQSAYICQLKNAKAQLVNANKVNRVHCAPIATAPLNPKSQNANKVSPFRNDAGALCFYDYTKYDVRSDEILLNEETTLINSNNQLTLLDLDSIHESEYNYDENSDFNEVLSDEFFYTSSLDLVNIE